MPSVHDRTDVLEALDQLPPHSWFLVCKTVHGLIDGIARVIVDDPTPEHTLRDAIAASLERLDSPPEA
jgi:hypothetical protein